MTIPRRPSGTPKKRRPGQGSRREEAFLQALSEGLSDEEFQRVATSALLALDDVGRERLFGQLGEGIAETLRRLLKAPKEAGGVAKPRASGAKVRQEWERAWDAW